MPELVIGYDENSRPVEAVCSACGEEMPAGEQGTKTTLETIRWFSAQFRLHVDREHPDQKLEA